jgi:hypothetical protein
MNLSPKEKQQANFRPEIPHAGRPIDDFYHRKWVADFHVLVKIEDSPKIPSISARCTRLPALPPEPHRKFHFCDEPGEVLPPVEDDKLFMKS